MLNAEGENGMTEDERIISGKRLTECMDRQNKDNKDLVCQLDLKGCNISTSFLSQMRSGHRSISYSTAVMLAECLNIDEGYLLGKDNFEATNYFDYLYRTNHAEEMAIHSPDIKRKATIIKMAGYSSSFNFDAGTAEVDAEGITSSHPFSIEVSNKTEKAQIPYSYMEVIEKQVIQYAEALIHAAVIRYQPKVFDSVEDFNKERYGSK